MHSHIPQEYELQDTAESKFVKDLDRLDMVIQAYEYEQQEQRPGFLQEFFDSTEGDKIREREERGGGGHRETHRQTERERENSNLKTLFSKDCRLGSVKNLSKDYLVSY